MEARIQAVSIIVAALLVVVILELVRRRRLMERYALLWLASGLILLALAIWRDGLTRLAHALGIFYPPNALFLIAFGFVLLLLMHFSIAVSKLSDQTKVLAQKLSLLEQRVRSHEEGEAEPSPEYDETRERVGS
jgi:hypothetical protein